MDRFASITDEGIAFLVQEKDSDNTKKATCVLVAPFRKYLQEKKLCKDIISLQLEELAQYLKKF